LPILDIDHVNVGPYIRNKHASTPTRNIERAKNALFDILSRDASG